MFEKLFFSNDITHSLKGCLEAIAEIQKIQLTLFNMLKYWTETLDITLQR